MFIADRKPPEATETYVGASVNADHIDGMEVRWSTTGTSIMLKAGAVTVMLYGPAKVTPEHVSNALAQLAFNSDPWDIVYADEFLAVLEGFL